MFDSFQMSSMRHLHFRKGQTGQKVSKVSNLTMPFMIKLGRTKKLLKPLHDVIGLLKQFTRSIIFDNGLSHSLWLEVIDTDGTRSNL